MHSFQNPQVKSHHFDLSAFALGETLESRTGFAFRIDTLDPVHGIITGTVLRPGRSKHSAGKMLTFAPTSTKGVQCWIESGEDSDRYRGLIYFQVANTKRLTTIADFSD